MTDLAVVRITGKDLPAPLGVSSADLYETQPVWVFGFPFGEKPGQEHHHQPERRFPACAARGACCRRLQVNGGMHPGNSGGPVVDKPRPGRRCGGCRSS